MTKPVLFISDLHLCESRPHITAALLLFLQDNATQAKALYILGDFFESWAGDDDINDLHHQSVISALRALANSGTKIYLMHGNRDFLISTDFCAAAKVTLLQDPHLIHLHGKSALLTHGDALCTDDLAYQEFRLLVRNKQWQSNFLNQPLSARKNQIEAIRNRSEQDKSNKSAQIMDTNEAAIYALLRKYNFPELLIHGHTHRPRQHQIQIDGHNIVRWVLGDWYEQGSYLSCDQSGCRSQSLY